MILNATVSILSRNPQASVSDIAIEAGVARRTLYGYFASRNELFEAAAHRLVENVSTPFDYMIYSDPLVALAKFFKLRWVNIAQLVQFANKKSGEDFLHEAAKGLISEIASLLDLAQKSGNLSSQIPATVGAHAAVFVQWGLFQALSEDRILLEDASSCSVRLMLRSVGAAPSEIDRILILICN